PDGRASSTFARRLALRRPGRSADGAQTEAGEQSWRQTPVVVEDRPQRALLARLQRIPLRLGDLGRSRHGARRLTHSLRAWRFGRLRHLLLVVLPRLALLNIERLAPAQRLLFESIPLHRV